MQATWPAYIAITTTLLHTRAPKRRRRKATTWPISWASSRLLTLRPLPALLLVLVLVVLGLVLAWPRASPPVADDGGTSMKA